MGCCDTKWYDLPLGDPCTAEELKHYFNSLLCQVDEKLHNVQMMCANPNNTQMECIVSDLNQLRYKILAIESAIAQNNIRMKCIAERNDENHLDIIKLDERLKVAVVDIDNALLQVKEAVAKVDLVAEQFDEVQETVNAFDGRMDKAESDIKGNADAIARNANRLNQLNQVVDSQGDSIDEQKEISNAIKATIAELNSEVSYLKDANSSIEDEIELLDSSVSNLSGQLSSVKEQITELETDANVEKGKLSAVEQLYGNLSARVQALRTDVDTLLAGGSGGEGGDYTPAIESLQASVEKINTDLENLTTTVNSLSGNMDLLTGRVSTVEGTMTDVSTNIEKNTKEIDTLKNSVDSMGTVVTIHGNDIDKLKQDLSDTSAKITTNIGMISQLRGETAENAGSISKLKDAVDELESTDARHDQYINQLNQRVDELEESSMPDYSSTITTYEDSGTISYKLDKSIESTIIDGNVLVYRYINDEFYSLCLLYSFDKPKQAIYYNDEPNSIFTCAIPSKLENSIPDDSRLLSITVTHTNIKSSNESTETKFTCEILDSEVYNGNKEGTLTLLIRAFNPISMLYTPVLPSSISFRLSLTFVKNKR